MSDDNAVFEDWRTRPAQFDCCNQRRKVYDGLDTDRLTAYSSYDHDSGTESYLLPYTAVITAGIITAAGNIRQIQADVSGIRGSTLILQKLMLAFKDSDQTFSLYIARKSQENVTD